MKHRTLAVAFLPIALAASLAASCATTGGASGPNASFYDANAKTFTVKTLDNGVKLVVKKNELNRVLNLKLVISGGSAAIPAARAGIEAVGLAMLSHGSGTYSYDDIQSMLYRKSAAIGSSGGYDYATYDLNCIDKYFPELFEVFIDGAMAPLFDEGEFENVLNDAMQGAEERFGDPDEYARWLGTQAIFAGHPYASDPNGSPESLQSITLDDVKEWYAQALDADRLSIVAVGNFDAEELYGKLNATIGTIARKGGKLPAVPALATKQDVVADVHEAAEGTAFVQGYFTIPGRADPDYVPFALAADMLDDVFFNVVREKYGACYSIQTIFRPAKASYGIVWVYQVSKPAEVKGYVDEAVSIMADGKLIMMKDPATGDYVYSTIAERLEAYKNKYVNIVYAQQRTNADVGGSVVRSMVYLGDHGEYLRIVDKIRAVTAADVENAFRKYILGGNFTWVTVSDEAGLAEIDEADYQSIGLRK
ncbi:MAG: pitrilysin family protein [Spirochaetes bacterium]|nr:pitrilysin family protein [Spirochaetota bacterium]